MPEGGQQVGDDGAPQPESEEASTDSERRTHPRKLVCMAAHLEVSGRDEPHMAIVRDVSVTGALLLTRTKPDVGEVVDLQLFPGIESGPEELGVRAKTIRVQPVDRNERGIWRYRVALEFEDDLKAHEGLIDELASKLQATGLAS